MHAHDRPDVPHSGTCFVFVGFMVSWVIGSDLGSLIALAFLAAGGAAFVVGFEVEERWKRMLGRQAAQMGGDS